MPFDDNSFYDIQHNVLGYLDVAKALDKGRIKGSYIEEMLDLLYDLSLLGKESLGYTMLLTTVIETLEQERLRLLKKVSLVEKARDLVHGPLRATFES